MFEKTQRRLGREADQAFKDIREELASLLDNTIENSEKIPGPDLWSDFAAGFGLSLDTLQKEADKLDALARQAYWIEDERFQRTLPR